MRWPPSAYAAGLQDQVTLLMQDYRDLQGQFDKLVSIEMIEAIGAEYLDTYMATLQRLLKPDGVALLQAITIEDHRYEQARRSVDYIKRYVFPGSFIPSINAIMAAKTRSSDLQLIAQQDFGHSYALTLRAWRQRFLAQLPAVQAQGFDARFCRLWEFYLAYCEGGFLERSIGVSHLLLARPATGPAAAKADMRRFWANLLGNQLVWLCAVAGAGRQWPAAGRVALHRQPAADLAAPRLDLRLMLLALACAWLVDASAAASGTVRYAAAPLGWAPPPWIMALWAAFAMTLTTSMRFLQRHPALPALFGLLLAPLAYLSPRAVSMRCGSRSRMAGLLVLGAGWSIALSLLCRPPVAACTSRSPRPERRHDQSDVGPAVRRAGDELGLGLAAPPPQHRRGRCALGQGRGARRCCWRCSATVR
jgi:hypothetical protein